MSSSKEANCSRCSRKLTNDAESTSKLCNICIGKSSAATAFGKCVCCRDPCQLSSTMCGRCEKNEAKYGKPTVCQYCQLPAAFLGKTCQHCSNNEKRFGAPQACQHCKLKAAFLKHPEDSDQQKRKKLLCRLCKSTYDKSLAVAEQFKVKKRKISSSGYVASDSTRVKQRHVQGESKSQLSQQTKDAFGDHVFTVTQLKDENTALKRQIQQKDQAIFERDKKMADFKAQLLQMDREHRSRVNQMQKEHQNQIETLQDKLRIVSKQVSVLSKTSKTSMKKLVETK